MRSRDIREGIMVEWKLVRGIKMVVQGICEETNKVKLLLPVTNKVIHLKHSELVKI